MFDAFIPLLHSVLVEKIFANASRIVYLTLGIFPNPSGGVFLFPQVKIFMFEVHLNLSLLSNHFI